MSTGAMARVKKSMTPVSAPARSPATASRLAPPQRVDDAPAGAGLGHDFARVPLHAPAIEACPLQLSAPRACPFGGACHTCSAPAVQAKLTVNQPGDEYEQEADRVAEQVMRMPELRMQLPSGPDGNGNGDGKGIVRSRSLAAQITPLVRRQAEPKEEEEEEKEGTLQTKPLAEQITPSIQRQDEPEEEEEDKPVQAKLTDKVQRQCAGCEEEEKKTTQAKRASGRAPQAASGLEAQIGALRQGGGQPLPEGARAFFEPRFGYDFSRVRVHANTQATESARALCARAYTVGRDVAFAAGQYAPETAEGRNLLAHELTHVVQADPKVRSTPQTNGNVIRRSVQSDVERIESLLSYGIFDWKITDAEAIEALEILSNLSPDMRVAALRRINVGRLRENLPPTHLPILERIIAQAGGEAPLDASAAAERINSLLSYGIFDWAITDAEATEALNLLLALSPDEQQRVVLTINHQRLYENLPTEAQKTQLENIRRPALARETTETATMEANRARARTILDQIKANADALVLPSPPASGAFETWLSRTYLSAYCANRNSENARRAIQEITREGASGFTHYGYGLLRGMADEAGRAGIGYIDSPYLLGTPAPGSVTSLGFFDPWSQGPNPTQLMHFAAGMKWSWAPTFLVQWYFVHYEQVTEEGWQIFGLDSLNDIIAEEGGRLLAIDLQAGNVSCSSAGVIDLDPYFAEGRRFLKSRLSASELDRLAMRVYQPNMVVATGAAGGGVLNQPLWNQTVMEQIMAGASDASILASPDARILTLLYHLLRRD
jgi:hypothetical protein